MNLFLHGTGLSFAGTGARCCGGLRIGIRFEAAYIAKPPDGRKETAAGFRRCVNFHLSGESAQFRQILLP
jgi:hypothetical protein